MKIKGRRAQCSLHSEHLEDGSDEGKGLLYL